MSKIEISYHDPKLPTDMTEDDLLRYAWNEAGGKDGFEEAIRQAKSPRFPTLHDRTREVFRRAELSKTFDAFWNGVLEHAQRHQDEQLSQEIVSEEPSIEVVDDTENTES